MVSAVIQWSREDGQIGSGLGDSCEGSGRNFAVNPTN